MKISKCLSAATQNLPCISSNSESATPPLPLPGVWVACVCSNCSQSISVKLSTHCKVSDAPSVTVKEWNEWKIKPQAPSSCDGCYAKGFSLCRLVASACTTCSRCCAGVWGGDGRPVLEAGEAILQGLGEGVGALGGA